MADYADLLIAEQSNPNAALLQLLLEDYTSCDRILAVEGPDDKIFYFDFVREYLNDKRFIVIDCGGKIGVLGLKNIVQEIDWDNKDKIRFICDKDFDDYIGIIEEGVFYTEGYSIESYFVGIDYLDYIVQKYSKKPLSQKELDSVRQAFQKRYDSMVAKMRLVSALMIEARVVGVHPNFDSTSVADFFELGVDFPRSHAKKWQAIKSSWNLPNIPGAVIKNRAKAVLSDDSRKWLRGKYAMQIAKICFQRAFKYSSESIKAKCPDGNFYSAEAFRYSKSFIGDILMLRDYVRS